MKTLTLRVQAPDDSARNGTAWYSRTASSGMPGKSGLAFVSVYSRRPKPCLAELHLTARMPRGKIWPLAKRVLVRLI